MFKTFLLIVSIFTILSISACGESGIKLSFDTQLLNMIKKVDLNSKFANMSLIGAEGIKYDKPSFPSVHLNVYKLFISKMKNPEDIIIDNDKDSKFLQVKFRNFDVELKTSYDVKVMTYLKDQGENSKISLEMEEFLIGFQFTKEKVIVKTFDFKIKHADVELNSWFYDIVKRLFMGLIIKNINNKANSFKTSLEEKLNNAINSQYLIDLGGMGIGINSTITEIPNMDVYDMKKKEYKNILMENANEFFNVISDAFEEIKEEKNFLHAEKEIKKPEILKNNEDLKSFLSFGLRGQIFATIMRELKPKINEPVDMKFNERLNKNNVKMLISDYSVNTLLFFGQQTGQIAARITNDTNAYLPFNSDIEGFKTIFPKFSQLYPENFPVELNIKSIPKSKQPLMNTHADGSKISFNLDVELLTYNSTDIFDDPITDLKLDFDGHFQMQYMFDENEILHIVIFKTFVDNINIQTNNLTEDPEELKKNLAKITDNILDSFRPSISNINAGEMIKNMTGFGVDNIEFDTRKEHMELAFDIVDQ